MMNFHLIISGPPVHVKIYCTTVKDAIQKPSKKSSELLIHGGTASY